MTCCLKEKQAQVLSMLTCHFMNKKRITDASNRIEKDLIEFPLACTDLFLCPAPFKKSLRFFPQKFEYRTQYVCEKERKVE